MSLTIDTQDLILLISAAKLTAYSRPDEDGILSGVYLYTTTGESGDEVGTGDLLVGVGFDGVTSGQFAVPVSGQLPHPILVPHRDTGWLAAMCNKAKLVAGKTDKDAEHTVELVVSGNSLKVTTLTDGEPADYDVDGRCPILDTSQYPVSEADSKLKSKSLNPSAAVVGNPDALVHVLGQTALTVMKNAAKVLKHPIRVFPSAANGGPIVMTDGERWRAVTSVDAYSGGTEGQPDIEPITVPEAPPTSAQTS